MSVNTVLYYEFHLCTRNIWKYVYSLRNVKFRHMMCVYISGVQENYDCAKNPKSELVKRKSFPRPATWPLDAVLCPCGPGCGALSEHMASQSTDISHQLLLGWLAECTHVHMCMICRAHAHMYGNAITCMPSGIY